MTTAMEKWEKEDGVKFLHQIGIQEGQAVLDFGARVGHYTIPAALAVGMSGRIYAVDKERAALDELTRKAERLNLTNVQIVRTNGRLTLDFKDESIDVVLLYDVLHYLPRDQREQLYGEIHRLLKRGGWISVYPKHVIEDAPLDQFRHLHWQDVRKEIEAQCFRLLEKHCDIISHDDFLMQGCVFNFIKTPRTERAG